MPSAKTYKSRGIVLRKTKLGEKDLVVTFIVETGELAKAVAKGARKPGGSFASKLELFSEVEYMAAKGRTLDVITEARFADGAVRPSYDLEQAACASVVADLLSYACQEGLEQPRVYEMAREALRVIAVSQPADALAVCAAALVKLVSVLGFRPYLDTCSSCGTAIAGDGQGAAILFSAEGGGAVCRTCRHGADGVLVAPATLAYLNVLLASRFVDVHELHAPVSASFDALQLLQGWVACHVGKRLNSLTYVFTCGLF